MVDRDANAPGNYTGIYTQHTDFKILTEIHTTIYTTFNTELTLTGTRTALWGELFTHGSVQPACVLQYLFGDTHACTHTHTHTDTQTNWDR